MDITINETVKQYAKQVKERYKPKAIYLYGSYAKGTANEFSDIDIAVVLTPVDPNEYMDIFSDLFSIAANFDENIEPNLLIDDGTEDKYSFLAEVKETGRRVDIL